MSRLSAIGVAVVVLVFAWVQSWSHAMVPGDEGIYVLASRWLAGGHMPYRDFFFAHPPLRLVLGALAVGWDGAPPLLVHAIPLLFLAVAAAILARLTARVAGSAWAIPAAAACLLMGPIVRDGPWFLGVEVVAAAAIASLALVERGRFALAGLALALGGLSSLHVLPLCAGPALAAVLSGRRALARFALGLSLLPAALLGLWAAFGEAFSRSVFAYHALKPASLDAGDLGSAADFFGGFVESAGPVLVLALAGCAAAARDARLRPAAVSAAAYLLAVGVYGSVHRYYLIPVMPVLALLAAAGARALLALIARASPDPRRARAAVALAAAMLGIGAALVAWDGLENQWNRSRLAPATEATVAALATSLDGQLPRDATLLGESTLVPWLALASGRRIAASEVDLNFKRFRVGLLTAEDLLRRARADGLGAVVTVESGGIERVPELMALLRRDFRPVPLTRVPTGSIRPVTAWLPR